MSLCKATLIGNVGRDPELRYTQSGKPVLNFSVACNRWVPPSDGERREETEWFGVVCFNRLAETLANLVQKGSRVYVEGRLQTRTYEGRDGQPRFVVEVVAGDVQLLSPRQARENGEQLVGAVLAASPTRLVGQDGSDGDEVPF